MNTIIMMINKKNIIVLLLLAIIPYFLMAQTKQQLYTVQQMKDTIAKYNDIFTAYNKLDSGRFAKNGYTYICDYPSYDSIRNDMDLKKSLLGLLDMNAYKKHLIKARKDKFIQEELSKNNFDKAGNFDYKTGANKPQKLIATAFAGQTIYWRVE